MWPPTSSQEVGGHIVCTVDYRINSDQISSRSTSRLIGLSAGIWYWGCTGDIQESSPPTPILCGKDAQEHVLRLRQLVLVLSLLKHEAGVRQQAYRERRGTIGAADAHAVAVIVGNLGPTHILMVARLLRHRYGA